METEPVEVDHTRLSREALQGVLESFVNREGTDYGLHEKTLAQKVADVLRQLEQGTAKLIYDPESDSIDIVPTAGTRRGR
jgi:uncharacterized protein